MKDALQELIDSLPEFIVSEYTGFIEDPTKRVVYYLESDLKTYICYRRENEDCEFYEDKVPPRILYRTHSKLLIELVTKMIQIIKSSKNP